ncbi:MAG: winged helix-turn-helix domain-containing protein [Acidobacteria bacterium]|nr:winged helix-turn-helix domain-containing protein [Acidobacteriota bacterium]
MGTSLQKEAVIRFGEFEANLRQRELRKQGQRIALPEKLFEILAVLLENPGEIISREDLYSRLWSTALQGDLEHNLNVCVSKLRHTLSDSAGNPRYIQTLSGRGYRLIAPVEVEQDWQPERQSGRPRLAVLPFETSDVAPEQFYFSDGLAGEIITQLGHLYPHRLGVIARSSVLKYRGSAKSVAQIGQELKVNYILEGSMRMSQEHLHITVQLVQVRDQTCIWAESFDYPRADPKTIQNDIAERVAQKLGLELLPEQAAASVKQNTLSPEAHLAYLKGCYYQSKATAETLRKSIECFERATQLDPAYGLAYCGISYSYSIIGLLGFAGPPKECFLPAAKAARAALRINANLSAPHVSLAIVKYLYEWDWAGSEKLFRRALELNPSDALAYRMLGYLLSSQRRHEAAIDEARRACELDPVSLLSNVCLGATYYLARRYDEAIATLQDILNVKPNFGIAMKWLGATYSLKSMHTEAIHILEKARMHYSRNPLILAWLGAAYARAGRKAQARMVLDELARRAAERYVSAFAFALVYAGLEQSDQNFKYLEKAFEEHCPFFGALLGVDPMLDALRSDPRYHALADRIRKAHSRTGFKI